MFPALSILIHQKQNVIEAPDLLYIAEQPGVIQNKSGSAVLVNRLLGIQLNPAQTSQMNIRNLFRFIVLDCCG